jgi:hypothetical protein
MLAGIDNLPVSYLGHRRQGVNPRTDLHEPRLLLRFANLSAPLRPETESVAEQALHVGRTDIKVS